MRHSTAGSPIYDSLVAELGDVPTETRRTAEHIRLTVAAAVGSVGRAAGARRDAPETVAAGAAAAGDA